MEGKTMSTTYAARKASAENITAWKFVILTEDMDLAREYDETGEWDDEVFTLMTGDLVKIEQTEDGAWTVAYTDIFNYRYAATITATQYRSL